MHNTNVDITVFILVHNMARVCPSPQEKMKLLTYGGKHPHECMNGVQGIEQVHVKILNRSSLEKTR
jgi:hypothetical protein